MRRPPIISLLLAFCLLSGNSLPINAGESAQGSSVNSHSGENGWPRQVGCRIADGVNPDLFVMTLGDVQTPLATGVFDPSSDVVRLGDGTILRNFFHDSLGVKYFVPIDKRAFPLPPSGWCSWYYYYQELDEREIERNAQWIADSLKQYGAEVVQIDDGWQGTGHGSGENRDWTTIDKRFPHGMDALAAQIKKLGLKPGLWLAPHGQSNPAVIKSNPGVFLLKPDGASASETWEGRFLVDPSAPATHSYLANLFGTLVRWGYDYFKIDGQPIVLEEFRKNRSSMKVPVDDVAGVYRKTLQTIRQTIGNERYLLGCWGIPREGVGIMNGSRTGGDVLLGWDGFKVAVDATMKYYYLHNIAWYCDPDVMLIRSPLSVDQARAWATLQGLTGQALMASDRLTDLSTERVEILRRVFPAVDIRPLDLFPSSRMKRIWDLKVNQLGRSYDVVGLFNFDEKKAEYVSLRWDEIGLKGPVHVFDFWGNEYMGCWDGGLSVPVSPTSCRVLSLLPATERVQLISTSRHITQGWPDLTALAFDDKSQTYGGRSKVVKNDPYELRFVFPSGKNFSIRRATAGRLPVRITNHQGWAVVGFTSPQSEEVPWQVTFEPAEYYRFPVRKPDDLSYDVAGLDEVTLRWNPQYYLNAGYMVWLDGTLLGHTPTNLITLRRVDPTNKHLAQVASVWEDGTISKDRAELSLDLASMIPGEAYVSDLRPDRWTIGWGTMEMDRAVTSKPLSIGGKRFAKGIGTHADSDVEFNLYGLYDRLTAQTGIDDGNGSDKGSVEFSVTGDGKVLWQSGLMKKSDAAKSLSVNITGVRKLLLRVTSGGDGIDYDHADWTDAKLVRLKK